MTIKPKLEQMYDNLKFINEPGPLYKYRSFNTKTDKKRIKEILETGHLYASEMTNLNDPMEGIYNVIQTPEGRKIVNEKNRIKMKDPSFFKELNKRVHNYKMKLKILSLTSDHNSLLMWSHYADGHKGVVIEVELKKNII